MTVNRRITLNVLATYGRSFLAMVFGLFTGRWALLILGEKDYGLYGVVAGLSIFLEFFTHFLSSAVCRYYAYSIGQASEIKDALIGVEESKRWFNSALVVHVVFSVTLLCVGVPVGMWLIDNWLVIPAERILISRQIFGLVCMSTFLSFINVPFRAMYVAKQYIAELTLYSFLQTIGNFFFLYWLLSCRGDCLFLYAWGTMLIACCPQLLICLRAICVFPECRVNLRYLFDLSRIKMLCKFSFWNLIGGLGVTVRGYGTHLVINKFFGTAVNAAMTIGTSVNGHCSSLAAALNAAFTPAITTSCGAGRKREMCQMAFRCCKFGTVLAALFILPLMIEIDPVITLWLSKPPKHASFFCLVILSCDLISRLCAGHYLAINAHGRIALAQVLNAGALILAIPVSIIILLTSGGIVAIAWGYLASTFVSVMVNVGMARILIDMSLKYWLHRVFIPIVVTISFSVVVGLVPSFVLSDSLGRIVLTTVITDGVLLIGVWLMVLDLDERRFLKEKLVARIRVTKKGR